MSDSLEPRSDGEGHEVGRSSASSEVERFLLFSVKGLYYGTPLLGVREVAEVGQVKPVPGTRADFAGVVNLRGQIVPVIDLKKHFGQADGSARGRAMMVFETESGPVAALVDTIDSVVPLTEDTYAGSSTAACPVDPEDLLGVVQVKDRLVSLIDLNRVVSRIEVRLS